MKISTKSIVIFSVVAAIAITLVSTSGIYLFYMNHNPKITDNCASIAIGGPSPTPIIGNGGYPITWLVDNAYPIPCSNTYQNRITYNLFGLVGDLLIWFVIAAAVLSIAKKAKK